MRNKRSPCGAISTIAQGQAGVYRVASELMLRGFKVFQPCVDDHGVDLLVRPNVRIQVKCTRLATRGDLYRGQPAYWFKFVRQQRTYSRIISFTPRMFSDQSDFVVLWGIDQHRFWIVPSKLLDLHQLVVVGPDIWYRDVNITEAERLRAQGLSIEQVADRMNVSFATVWRRLNGEYCEPKLTISSQVRVCENKWDYISDMVALQEGADVLDPTLTPEPVQA